MAAVQAQTNGANGVNGVNGGTPSFPPARWSEVPPMLSFTLPDQQDGEAYDIELSLGQDLDENLDGVFTLLETERMPRSYWMTVALAYAKHDKVEAAIDLLRRAKDVFGSGRAEDRLHVLNALCWLYLLKYRAAVRLKPDGETNEQAKSKEFYFTQATTVLNDASRINPSFPPLHLARGVLSLFKASAALQSTGRDQVRLDADRTETLRQAGKFFDDALRVSQGKGLMAKLGRARVDYALGKYADALKLYQAVLAASPNLTDPDPRIGIGCCYWQLQFKDDAASAWERSLELNPTSKTALILLGLYTFHCAAQLHPSHPDFLPLCKKAIEKYVQPALKLDKMFPLTCVTIANWFVMTKNRLKDAATVAKRAFELSDVNEIISDGYYHLARKEHIEGNTSSAIKNYEKSDKARGGDQRGYIPAKFGSAQLRVLMGDSLGAKHTLERILQKQPTLEAQILLGTLFAEEVFEAQAENSKEDKSNELKKALKYLEDVAKAWKDPKRNLTPDRWVLLNLARLYEIVDQPDKSLKCLEEVEQLLKAEQPDEDLPPQLLNNMGCFHFQSERYVQARELFQTALNACVKAASKDPTIDTDALVTSISYNLGRTYESEGMLDEAKEVYDNLLKRHANYIDARIRLAYISLRQSPTDEGPRAVGKLMQDHESNLEVRALYGWYLNKSKPRVADVAEDKEQRHYKRTLQGNGGANKHDQYALTGLGNVHLTAAREMRGTAEQDKEKRNKAYAKAAEFYEKVLQVDGKNAYAAQGIAIALIENKKDHATGIQILNKVKETLKDYSVFLNLGHAYCDTQQYPRAIENYEAALAKAKPNDVNILACLGRAWLLRGKAEKSLSAMNSALEYSRRALEIAPEQVHFQFNVAFVQMQIAQLIHQLKESERTLADVEAASAGLESAIEVLTAISKTPNPPFPAHDIGSRADMGRNTMRKQLVRAREAQAKYEEANHSKLEQARALREAEFKRREEERRKAEEEAAERRRKILEEQQKLQERDREYMERRAEEERRRQELIDDSNLHKAERGSRKKGGKRKKKGDMDDSDSSGSDNDRSRRGRTTASATEGLTDEERPRQKKRKLERRKKEPTGKYKSSEMVVDSDEDLDADVPDRDASTPAANGNETGDEQTGARRPRKTARVIDEDEDEDTGGSPKQTTEMAMDEDEE